MNSPRNKFPYTMAGSMLIIFLSIVSLLRIPAPTGYDQWKKSDWRVKDILITMVRLSDNSGNFSAAIIPWRIFFNKTFFTLESVREGLHGIKLYPLEGNLGLRPADLVDIDFIVTGNREMEYGERQPWQKRIDESLSGNPGSLGSSFRQVAVFELPDGSEIFLWKNTRASGEKISEEMQS